MIQVYNFVHDKGLHARTDSIILSSLGSLGIRDVVGRCDIAMQSMDAILIRVLVFVERDGDRHGDRQFLVVLERLRYDIAIIRVHDNRVARDSFEVVQNAIGIVPYVLLLRIKEWLKVPICDDSFRQGAMTDSAGAL